MQKQAISTAIIREASIGEFLLGQYTQKIGFFEKKYKLSTSDFIKKFESGKAGDSEDFFEWFAVAKAQKHWTAKLKELKSGAA